MQHSSSLPGALKLTAATLVAGLIFTMAGCGGGSSGSASETGTLVTIAASGKASQAPDVANLSAGVVTEAENSGSAMKANAEQMLTLLKAIKEAGIDEKDVQTSGISLSPVYSNRRIAGQQQPTITGYRARNMVNITVRNLETLGETLDKLSDAGANNIHGPSFSIGEPEPLLAKARERALKQARSRAENYAESLGMKVKRIVSISEGHGGGPRPMMRTEMSMATDSTPVALGESTVNVQLQLVFELKD